MARSGSTASAVTMPASSRRSRSSQSTTSLKETTMFRYFAAAAFGIAVWVTASSANAQATVECQSRHYQYGECYAGPLKRPQLIHQISGSSCILNKTWGYNPKSRYIWVAQGCSGVFADVGGYHHGRGD